MGLSFRRSNTLWGKKRSVKCLKRNSEVGKISAFVFNTSTLKTYGELCAQQPNPLYLYYRSVSLTKRSQKMDWDGTGHHRAPTPSAA